MIRILCWGMFLAALLPKILYAHHFYDVEKICSEDNLLIVTIHIDDLILDEIIEIYAYEERVFIPLGQVSHIIGFAIKTHPHLATAQGWFYDETQSFFLDMRNHQVTIRQDTQPIDPHDIIANDEDIFIDITLFAEWFAVPMVLNQHYMSLHLQPVKPLAVQAKHRRTQLQQTLKKTNEVAIPHYNAPSTPSSLLSAPFIDGTLAYRYGRHSPHTHQMHYTLQAQQELLHLHSSFYIAGHINERPETIRYRLQHYTPAHDILGPLRASSIAMGDIYTTWLPLVARHDVGRGIVVSNMLHEHADRFDVTSFLGEVKPYWEVELYRNDVLIDAQIAANDGRYRFDEVVLFYGRNDFRIVAYGPQGQIKETYYHYPIDGQMLTKNQLRYAFSIDQKQRNLWEVRKRTHDIPNDIRINARGVYGIAPMMTTTWGYAHIPFNDGETRHYGMWGLRTRVFDMLMNIESAYNFTDHSYATAWTMQHRIADTSIRMQHLWFDDFISELYHTAATSLKMRSTLDIYGALDYRTRYRLGVDHQRFSTLNAETLLRYDISHHMGLMHISHEMQWKIAAQDGWGNLAMRSRYKRWLLRMLLHYNIDPHIHLERLSITAQRDLQEQNILRLAMHTTLDEAQEQAVSLSYSHPFDHSLWSISAQMNTHRDIALGVTLSFGLGREPYSKEWYSRPRHFSNTSTVSALAYIDRNYNGHYDAEETLLPDVTFTHKHQRYEAKSGKNPTVITHIPPHQEHVIQIDQTSIENPYHQAMHKGMAVTLPPNRATMLHFPIIETAEIEGSVYEETQYGKHPVAGVTLQLRDYQNHIVATTVSEYDGVYIFDKVAAGEYFLTTAAYSTAPIRLYISPSDEIISEVDIILPLPQAQ